MGALDGIRVLDCAVIVQGPQAAAMLSDLGAEVIKVELPVLGDIARWIPMTPEDRRSAYFYALNRGKRSITLDLHHEAARDVLRRLVARSDVIISSFHPGVMDAWGIGYENLRAVNPRIIYATVSAFGPTGPDAAREGADMSGQAAGGLISTTGEDGTFPTPVGAVIADHCGSQNLATGILAALYYRERTGKGQRVDASLLGGQIWAQASEITHYLLTGRVPGRANRGHPLLAGVYGIFPTADGAIAIIGAAGKLWPGFCRALELPELLTDPRFATDEARTGHRAELFALLDARFQTRTTDAWCERLRAEEQRYAPVRDYAAVAADPQVWANGYLVEVEHPQWGKQAVIGSPIRLSETPATPGAVTPEVGQHTEEILLEAGYTWDEIAALRAQGAV